MKSESFLKSYISKKCMSFYSQIKKGVKDFISLFDYMAEDCKRCAEYRFLIVLGLFAFITYKMFKRFFYE